jgi:hypothetical protein
LEDQYISAQNDSNTNNDTNDITDTNFTQWTDNTNCQPTLPVVHIVMWGPSEGKETGQSNEKNECIGMYILLTLTAPNRAERRN